MGSPSQYTSLQRPACGAFSTPQHPLLAACNMQKAGAANMFNNLMNANFMDARMNANIAAAAAAAAASSARPAASSSTASNGAPSAPTPKRERVPREKREKNHIKVSAFINSSTIMQNLHLLQKPCNAFMLFMRENRHRMAADTHVKQSSELNKVMGEVRKRFLCREKHSIL